MLSSRVKRLDEEYTDERLGELSLEELEALLVEVKPLARQASYQRFLEYNVHDVNLVKRIDEKKKLFALVFALAYLMRANYEDTLATVRPWSSFAYFDLLKHGVKIVGHLNVPGRLPKDASQLFARNVLNFLTPHVDKEQKSLAFNWEDETVSGTLVTKDGKTFMVLGSPGGSRIISITLQTALNVIDHGMAPQEAVDAPRIHQQWLPDEVYYEARGLSADTLKSLKAMGYKMTEQTPWGAAEVILYGLPGAAGVASSSGNDGAVSGKVRPGFIYGANDPRRPAGAAIPAARIS